MSEERIKIYLRIRPIEERYSRFDVAQSFNKSTFSITRPIRPTSNEYINNTKENFHFKFDGVLEDSTKQPETFERVAKQCVLSALDGYNSTLFCYGQTGSGKTWSMTGGAEHYDDRGIIPRSLSLIFQETEKRATSQLLNFTISVSYLEIYQGKGYDLLDDSRTVKDLKDLPRVQMLEDGDGNMLLRNIRCKVVRSEEDALESLWVGDTNRVVSSTEMNDQSSRSHCIFTVVIESRPINGSAVIRVSKLHLVDLAGSERVYRNNVEGNTLMEARGINSSLHFLERVIVSLSKNLQHIPYRNSMLTTVLRDSIGGNCKTVMIANINPSHRQINETISTCRFAQRVASIKQKVTKNQSLDRDALIKMLKRKVSILQEKLAFYENNNNNNSGGILGANEKAIVESKIKEFIQKGRENGNDEKDVVGLEGKYERIQFGFITMRSLFYDSGRSVNIPIRPEKKQPEKQQEIIKSIAPTRINDETLRSFKEQVKKYETAINLRNIEIDILVNMLTKKNQKKMNISTQTSPKFRNNKKKTFKFQKQQEEEEHEGEDDDDNNNKPVRNSNNEFIYSKPKSIRSQVQYQAKLHVPSSSSSSSSSQQVKNSPIPAHPNPNKSFEDKLQEQSDQPLTIGMLDRARAFQIFRKSYRKHELMERTKKNLGEKFLSAKTVAKKVNQKRNLVTKLKSDLIKLKTKHVSLRIKEDYSNPELLDLREEEMKKEILFERDEYYKLVEELKKSKNEIEYLQRGLQRSSNRLQSDFEKWYQTFNFRKDDYVEIGSEKKRSLTIAPIQDLGSQILGGGKTEKQNNNRRRNRSVKKKMRKKEDGNINSRAQKGRRSLDHHGHVVPVDENDVYGGRRGRREEEEDDEKSSNTSSMNTPFLQKLRRYQELRRKIKKNNFVQ